MFNVDDWYWRADNGRVYSSAREAVITIDDETYVAFLVGGELPAVRPRDDDGHQTNAAVEEAIIIAREGA